MDMLKFGCYYRDEREIGFYKNLRGESSNIINTRREVTKNYIGYLLPLHSLLFYIIRYHGIIYIIQLIGINILFVCMLNPKLYKFLKNFKLRYPKFD